jgi:hypothetical protein
VLAIGHVDGAVVGDAHRVHDAELRRAVAGDRLAGARRSGRRRRRASERTPHALELPVPASNTTMRWLP